MPKILTWKGYVFFFYSNEGQEPAHIHVRSQGREAKFWLSDLVVAENSGFADHQINEISKHIAVHRQSMIKAWRDHFER